MPSDPVVLVLCTANPCRSPAAAAALVSRLRGTGVVVESAGFTVRPGAVVDERTRHLVPEVAPDAVPRQLTTELLLRADLVLTMTRAQRATAVGLVPACVRRTFTLPELADLARLVGEGGDLPDPPADRLRRLVRDAPRLRGARGADPDRRPDDVPDPYQFDDEAYATVIGQVVAAVDDVARCVLGAPAQTAPSSPSGVRGPGSDVLFRVTNPPG